MKRLLVAILVIVFTLPACSSVKKTYEKIGPAITADLKLEEQKMLDEKYVGHYAWTRVTVEDLTERETPGEPKKRIVPIDTKVEVHNLNYTYNGAISIIDTKGRQIVYGLDIERPLTVEKIEARLAEIFWFQSPLLRHVDYIRQWGKKTASAVVNHEVFVGMPAEAAVESWGIPDTVNRSPFGDKEEEQWVYKGAKRSRYIYVIEGIVTKWEE